MTVEIMKAFGAQVDSSKPNSYTVHPTGYVGRDYEIETDASTASYFFAAAAASKGRVVVNGIGQTQSKVILNSLRSSSKWEPKL